MKGKINEFPDIDTSRYNDEFFFKVYVGRTKNGSICYHAEKDDFLPIVPSAKEKGWEVDSLRVCQLL